MKGHTAQKDINNVADVKAAKSQYIEPIDFATDPRYRNPNGPKERKEGKISTRVLSQEMAESLDDD